MGFVKIGRSTVWRDDFNESDHPRAKDGKFGSGGGGESNKPNPASKKAGTHREETPGHTPEQKKEIAAGQAAEVEAEYHAKKKMEAGIEPNNVNEYQKQYQQHFDKAYAAAKARHMSSRYNPPSVKQVKKDLGIKD